MIVKLQETAGRPAGLTATRFSFDTLPAGVRATWTELAGDHFMSEPAWLEHAWRLKHLAEPGVTANGWRGTLVTDDSGIVCGVVPWFLEKKQGLRKLRLAGSGQVCSDYVQLPARPGMELEIAETVSRELLGNPAAGSSGYAVDLVEIEGHETDLPQWNRFFGSMTAAGWRRITTSLEGSWRTTLPSTWQEYDAQLHKSRRRKARRAIKLAEQGEVTHRAFETAGEISEVWPEFVRLHQMRRNQLGQPGCFSDPAFETFLKTASMELASRNRAWLSMVSQQGSPLAFLLMFDSPTTSYMYQSGIDVSRLQLAPGHLINALTIRHAIGRGKKFFDLLRGDEPYKSGWMAERIPLARTRLFAPTFRGRAMHAACSLRNRCQNWRERFRNDRGPVEQHEGGDED